MFMELSRVVFKKLSELSTCKQSLEELGGEYQAQARYRCLNWSQKVCMLSGVLVTKPLEDGVRVVS